jgi:mannosyltransferase OCH1-like enzyme
MDLMCRRALGPLRRFNFVAPEAHETRFSIGFMMAERSNAFVGRILNSLPTFDKQWLWLPYAIVMFSTGCHFASVIHAMDPQRNLLKILPGPLHSLSGHVSTPLFEHLGSSSWHSYDARMLKLVDSFGVLFIGYIAIVCLVGKEIMRRRRAKLHGKLLEKK